MTPDEVVDGSEIASLCETIDNDIYVRGRSLSSELIGKASFTEMLLLEIDGTEASPARVRLVDAILVAIMEHGITPSTLATRLVLDGAPESYQGAVAAGLLGVGSRFLGVADEAAGLLRSVVATAAAEGTDLDAAAEKLVSEVLSRGARIPGVGHNLHLSEDPRVSALLRVARDEDLAGEHVRALESVLAASCRLTDRRLVVNVIGVIGALLSDLGYPPEQVRAFTLVARCAGLVAHVADERKNPVARETWEAFHRTDT